MEKGADRGVIRKEVFRTGLMILLVAVIIFLVFKICEIRKITKHREFFETYISSDPLVWAAEQTFKQAAHHIQRGEDIPERYWAKEIRELHPLRVYIHMFNIVVVQHATENIETGKYIRLSISSYIPMQGVDRFTYTSGVSVVKLTPKSTIIRYSDDDVYNYIRTVEVWNNGEKRRD
jgi:hypothetical protein